MPFNAKPVAPISQDVVVVDRTGSEPPAVSPEPREEDALESFRRRVGHELRTPLQALSMLVELMRRDSARGRPSPIESFSKARAQLDRLSNLVTNLAEAKRVSPASAPPAEAERRSDREAPGSGRAPERGASREGPSKILIVDDDPSIRDALGELLSDRYEILVAGNGEEAVSRLASAPVDLVVLDMVMPLLDGEGALREIRGRGLRVPVIVASARGDRLANYRQLGADDFIQKPFDVGTLENKIDRLLAAVS